MSTAKQFINQSL